MNDDTHTNNLKPTHIVGVGASAGGLEALERLFRAMPNDTDMAFVVIQHLSPDFKSLMDELMMRFTNIPVKVVESEIEVEPNCIYLLAPKKELVIEGHKLIAYDRPTGKQLTMPINVFFRSLAASWAEKAIAIVLSGTGTDGSDGVLNVRDAGGVVMVQDPSTAKFDGMPQSAIATGCVDAVLAPEDMPMSMLAIIKDPLFLKNAGKEELSEDELLKLRGIDRIYELLKNHYLIDFKLYKPSTITRRIQRRITMGGENTSLDEYVDLLERDAKELDALYKDLLIGVTTFFRDYDAYEALRTKALEKLLDHQPENQEFRVWVCGCSTGQEAYSLGMMILEEFEKRNRPPLIKIFATDLHRDSVTTAAEGIYSELALESVPSILREKYFISIGNGSYRVSPTLRKLIIFSEHNLLKNPPFTRMNLVSCRNLLIYFRTEAQIPAVTAFNFSLIQDGILFLGASETLGTLAEDFEVVDNHWKIYRKSRESRTMYSLRTQGELSPLDSDSGRIRSDRGQSLIRLYLNLLDRHIPSGILLSENHELLHVFGDAHRYLKIPSGRHTGDVFAMMGQSMSIALSTALRNTRNQSVSLNYRGIRNEDSNELVEITVEPIFDKGSGQYFFMVLLTQQQSTSYDSDDLVTGVIEKDFSLPEESAEYVRHLQDELQRIKEALQTNAEELETSNEELQASNEELQASNEELQSTNEELHSVNEELYTVNTELEQKILQLDRTSRDLRNLVDSTQIGTVFLDEDYKIRLFTPRATEIFNLLQKDVGRDIRHFTPKIADKYLNEDMEAAYSRGQVRERELEMGGLRFLRRCSPYSDQKGSNEGIILAYIDVSQVDLNPFTDLITRIKLKLKPLQPTSQSD